MAPHPLDEFFEDETIRAALKVHYRKLKTDLETAIPEFSPEFSVAEIEKIFETIGPDAVEKLVDKYVPSGLPEKHGTTLKEIKKRGRKRKFGLAAHVFRLSILSAVVGGSFVGTDDSPQSPYDVGSLTEDYDNYADEIRLLSGIEEGRVANPVKVLRASAPETEVSNNSTRVVASPGNAFEGFETRPVSYNETSNDDYYNKTTEEFGGKLARRPIYNRTFTEYLQSWERDGKAIYARASSFANSALKSLNLRQQTHEEFLDEVDRIEAETSEGGFRVPLNSTETETQESNFTDSSSRSAPADQEVTPRRPQWKYQRGSYSRKKNSPVLSRIGGVFDWAFGSGASADPPKPPDEIKVNADAPGKRRIGPLTEEEFDAKQRELDAYFTDLDARGQSQGWARP